MADLLKLFCDYYQLGKRIHLANSSGRILTEEEASHHENAQFLSFSSQLCYPLSAPSRLKCSRGGEEPFYPLSALYFLISRKDASYTEYLQEARSKGWASVSFVDRKEILNILSGTVKDSIMIDSNMKESFISPLTLESIQKAATLSHKRTLSEESCSDNEGGGEPSKKKVLLEEETEVLSDQNASGAEASDAELYLKSLKIKEKSLRPKNAIFLSKNKSYVQLISLMKSLLKLSSTQKLPHSSSSGGSNSQTKKPVPNAPIASNTKNNEFNVNMTASLLPSSVHVPPSSRSLGSQVPSAPRQTSTTKGPLYPIIIVPSTSSSLINLYNVRDFLEKERYVPIEEAKARMQHKKEPFVMIQRKCKAATQSTTQYQVIDSTQKLRPEDWSRVVAVFVQGAAWQFKGWKYDNPVELFNQVKGFHLVFDEGLLEPNIKTWDVTVLRIHKIKRHLDAEAVLTFWNKLDHWVAAKMPHCTPAAVAASTPKTKPVKGK